MNAIDEYLERNESEDPTMANLNKWDQGDLRRLISAYLGLRFPMALALNKSDKETAAKFVVDIIDSLPIHGARIGVPLSAKIEMNFMKSNILSSNQHNQKSKNDVEKTEKVGNGVWNCLQSAMCLREPVLVFPVSDMESYMAYSSMDEYAVRDASLPSLGMIACLEASGGVTPTLWNHERKMYISGVSEPLRDVLIMKQGSTVDNVYAHLKKIGAVSGEFVRAEAACNIGE